MPRRLLQIAIAVSCVLATSSAWADPIGPGLTTFEGRAIQDITVLGGTVLNGGPTFTIAGLYGDGYFTIDRSKQVGSSIQFTGTDSVFTGSLAQLGGTFTFGAAGAVGVGSYYGSIDNIVQNPNDPGYASGDVSSFVSRDLTTQVPLFYFKLANGAILETGAAFTFTATLDGLPNRTPTFEQGTMPVDSVPVYLGDPSNNILVGYSSNRHIDLRAVPEPASLALLGVRDLAGLMMRSRRRRSASAN